MISVKSIAWLAGIIEGEGFFQLSKGLYPVMSIKMTDEDTIAKVAKIWKRPYNVDRLVEKSGWRAQYRVNICGNSAIGWMLTIYCLMSYRRQSQILHVISKWKTTKGIHPDKFKCGHPKTPGNTAANRCCLICARVTSNKQYYIRKQALSQGESNNGRSETHSD